MKILYAYNTSKFSDCYGFIGSEERVKRKGREREKEQEGKTREREGKILKSINRKHHRTYIRCGKRQVQVKICE